MVSVQFILAIGVFLFFLRNLKRAEARYFADFRPFLAISQKKNVMKAVYFQLKAVYTVSVNKQYKKSLGGNNYGYQNHYVELCGWDEHQLTR